MSKRVLILSGPTHEYIDPVRFIGNASSGKMGKALAEAAIHQGHHIEFISGPVSSENLPDLEPAYIHKVVSAEQMLAMADKYFIKSDVIIFAAAVADYAPKKIKSEKMAKSSNDLTIELRPTPDIAKSLSAKKQPHQMMIGFALQTSNGEKNATRKLAEKKLDAIILNTPASLGADNGTFSCLLKKSENFDYWGAITKQQCAQQIINLFS